MDIEVVIKKTLIFAGLFAMVMVVVGTVSAVMQSYVARYLPVNPFVSTALSVLIAVSLYDPVRKLLVNLTDRFLFQRKYDYQKFLKDAAKGISQITSLDRLLKLVMHFITMRMRLKNAAVLIKALKTNQFRLDYLRGYPADFKPAGETKIKSPLIQYLTWEKEALEIEQLKEVIETGGKKSLDGKSAFHHDFLAIKKEMEEIHAACCVPSFLGKELRTVLVLGEKKSGDYYTTEDLNVLFTLAQESAIAIENARLYDEAIKRSRELETMNRELGETNERLKVAQASLIVAEKNATMVGMAKAIGHEVNNPLSTVMYRSQVISREKVRKCREILERTNGGTSEEDLGVLKKLIAGIDEDSQKALKAGKRINAVVHTLTNILKDTKGEMESLSLLLVCREAMEASRFSTYEENLRGCDIELDIQANVMIMGNLEQLLQVFVNLIKNAYEAMERQKDRKIVIKGCPDPDDPQMAKIEFVDNGPGIREDVLPKIWGQGFSTKTKKDDSIGAAGQGQGLYVCKHVIESLHKGSITVQSKPAVGTTFIMKLPLAEA